MRKHQAFRALTYARLNLDECVLDTLELEAAFEATYQANNLYPEVYNSWVDAFEYSLRYYSDSGWEEELAKLEALKVRTKRVVAKWSEEWKSYLKELD